MRKDVHRLSFSLVTGAGGPGIVLHSPGHTSQQGRGTNVSTRAENHNSLTGFPALLLSQKVLEQRAPV